MPTYSATIRAIAVLAIAGLTLAGCGTGEPSSNSTWTPKQVAPPSDGGGASGPTLPPENAALTPPRFEDYPGITEETDEGAMAATRYFFDAMYYGYATGDVGPFEKVSNFDSCKSCSSVREELQSQYSGSKSYISPIELTSEDLASTEFGDGKAKIFYRFATPKITLHENSAPPRAFEPVKRDAAVVLAFNGHHWVVQHANWQEQDE